DGLHERCFCTKVFVSPCSKSDEPLLNRDRKKDNTRFVDSITGCQDLRSMLGTKFKPIRLVVIDYAGLSTEPNDIRAFFQRYKQVRELVVDHGLTFEVFEQTDLQQNDDILSRFDCRSSPKHRSN
ncbi:hypothetical protein DM01DRAFT_1289165, partial [Hesseltinella vesiculosa]